MLHKELKYNRLHYIKSIGDYDVYDYGTCNFAWDGSYIYPVIGTYYYLFEVSEDKLSNYDIGLSYAGYPNDRYIKDNISAAKLIKIPRHTDIDAWYSALKESATVENYYEELI